jgi:hypothetical protein
MLDNIKKIIDGLSDEEREIFELEIQKFHEINDENVLDLREFMTLEQVETFNMCKHIMGEC